MASFIIHHIAGLKFLERFDLTTEEQNKFLLGNLIVDSTKTDMFIPSELDEKKAKILRDKLMMIMQDEKRKTHFRDIHDNDLVVQVPNVDNFISKYSNLIEKDITALGYLFHLYTDKMFFETLFNETFDFLDKNNNSTIYLKDVYTVRLKKNNEFHKLNDLSDYKYHSSLYRDYTIINKILLDYFNVCFYKDELLNYVNEFINPGIEEVDYSKITKIINQTDKFVKESYGVMDDKLNVFDEDVIKNFIGLVVDQFIESYGYLFELECNSFSKKI